MKKLIKRIKQIYQRLKKLDFKAVILLLLGIVVILIIINFLFIQRISDTTLEPDEPGYQIREENIEELEAVLPIYTIEYDIFQRGENIVISYDATVPIALEKAYLYLQQFGIFKEDPRIIEETREYFSF